MYKFYFGQWAEWINGTDLLAGSLQRGCAVGRCLLESHPIQLQLAPGKVKGCSLLLCPLVDWFTAVASILLVLYCNDTSI